MKQKKNPPIRAIWRAQDSGHMAIVPKGPIAIWDMTIECKLANAPLSVRYLPLYGSHAY